MSVASSANIRETTDSISCSGKSIRIERFEPMGANACPALLLLHGADGLTTIGPTYRELARRFAEQGYLVLLPHYLGDRPNRFGASMINPLAFLGWMEVVSQGLGYAVAQARVDPSRIGLIGISLGAYLALAVASQDRRARAVVDVCGGVPDFFAHRLQRMPPVLILHGDRDHVVPVEEAHKLAQLLQSKGQHYEIVIYHGQGHGFVGPDWEDALHRAVVFLNHFLEKPHDQGRG